MSPHAIASISLLSLGLAPAAARAACDCDHVIAVDQISPDGDALGVEPGQTVCLAPGERAALRLSNFHGTEEAPIVVRNCDGVAHIENLDRGYGITVDTSEHLRITGTGDPSVPYGIYVRAAKVASGPGDYSAMGVAVSGYSHYVEIDHLEIVDAGFAGIMVKTDPTCESPDLSAHVQREVRLHHNLIRNPGGEGFYLGSTGYPSRARTCNGTEIQTYPHRHEGLHVHDNVIENAGWDGLQVGVTPKDCFVYRNTVIEPGRLKEEYQSQGFQFGGASSCVVHSNYLRGGPAMGIIILDAGDMKVYNNVIVDFGAAGIYANLREAGPAGARYQFLHNTIVRAAEQGVQVFGGALGDSVAYNNLILESGDVAVSAGNDVAWDASDNIVDATVDAVGFVDAEAFDFRLKPTALAVNAGRPLPDFDITVDADGVERDDEPDVGAFELIEGERPKDPEVPGEPGEPGNPGEPGEPGNPGEPGEGSRDGGCTVAGDSGAGWLPLAWLLLVLGISRVTARRAGHAGSRS
jgi:hypothetical protein